MKKHNLYLALSTLIISTIIISCSVSNEVNSGRHIQKRKYTKGWFVKSNVKPKTLANDNLLEAKENKKVDIFIDKPSTNKDFVIKNASISENELIAVNENIVGSLTQSNNEKSSKMTSVSLALALASGTVQQDECDNIIFKDGHEERVKITEISQFDVKYKMCNNLGGAGFRS